jgi:hypothetical protein
MSLLRVQLNFEIGNTDLNSHKQTIMLGLEFQIHASRAPYISLHWRLGVPNKSLAIASREAIRIQLKPMHGRGNCHTGKLNIIEFKSSRRSQSIKELAA